MLVSSGLLNRHWPIGLGPERIQTSHLDACERPAGILAERTLRALRAVTTLRKWQLFEAIFARCRAP